MPKILFFLTSSYPYDSGETFIENEIPYLEKAFDKIIIICTSKLQPIKRYLPENAEVFSFNDSLNIIQKLLGLKFVFSRLFWDELIFIRNHLKLILTRKKINILIIEWRKALLLKKQITNIYKNKISSKDTVYIYSYWHDYKAISACLIKKKNPQTISLARLHGWDNFFERHSENYLPFKKYICSKLNGNFFISITGLNYIAEKLKLKTIGTNFFVSRLGTSNNFDNQIPIPKMYFLLISCSNIIPLKRIALIIDSLALIDSMSIEWVHFGTGIEYEKICSYGKAKLENKANIKYQFKGSINNSDILTFFHKNLPDLFINTSSTEGIPVSMMEAMSFGIPCIGTNVGGVSEIIDNNVSGFLMPPSPISQEVANTILKFYNLPEEEKMLMRQSAYNMWNKNYNAKINYSQFVKQIISL